VLVVIEVFLSNELFRDERCFIVHRRITSRILQDSLLSVVWSLESLEGGSERAISAG
jgi:hypothetical protein